MLNATAADSAKIKTQVSNVLTAHNFSGDMNSQVYVKTRKFYEACKVSSLPMRFFIEEVNDILSGTALSNKYGTWVFTEVGDGYSVFVRLCEPDRAEPGPGVVGLIAKQTLAGKASLYSFD